MWVRADWEWETTERYKSDAELVTMSKYKNKGNFYYFHDFLYAIPIPIVCMK